MRKTIQVRIGLDGHQFAKEYSREYGIPISQVMDLAIRYFNGEHKKEKAEMEAQFRAIFPDHKSSAMGQMTPKTASAAELSTHLKDLRKAMKTGEFWTSEKYSADNVRKMFES